MKKIPENIKQKIVFLLKSGESSREIAEICKISQTSVINIRKQTKIAVPVPKYGRKNLLTNRDARLMERQLRAINSKTPKEASISIGRNVSEWTARRALKRIGMVACQKMKKPALSKKNIKARLTWAKLHKNWGVDEWKRVIWSDETKVNRVNSDGRSYYWKKPGESLNSNQVKNGGGSLMTWGCFTWWGKCPLHKIEGIMNKEVYLALLKSNLVPFMEKCLYKEEDLIFQQDGDPKHTAKIVKSWLQKQKFSTMVWPAQSPDLNPIENLWAIVKRKLGKYETLPKNLDELWERMQGEWDKIPNGIIQNLVESMPRRVSEVVKKRIVDKILE